MVALYSSRLARVELFSWQTGGQKRQTQQSHNRIRSPAPLFILFIYISRNLVGSCSYWWIHYVIYLLFQPISVFNFHLQEVFKGALEARSCFWKLEMTVVCFSLDSCYYFSSFSDGFAEFSAFCCRGMKMDKTWRQKCDAVTFKEEGGELKVMFRKLANQGLANCWIDRLNILALS